MAHWWRTHPQLWATFGHNWQYTKPAKALIFLLPCVVVCGISRTHNPLVLGSNPRRPTPTQAVRKYPATAGAGSCVVQTLLRAFTPANPT